MAKIYYSICNSSFILYF